MSKPVSRAKSGHLFFAGERLEAAVNHLRQARELADPGQLKERYETYCRRIENMMSQIAELHLLFDDEIDALIKTPPGQPVPAPGSQ
jgi:hypothetical protein